VRHKPDVYLDEMRELLEKRRGTAVNDSTIWRALKRSGFTMKKISRRNARPTAISMAPNTRQNRQSSLTKAHLTDVQPYVVVLGLFRVNKLRGKPSFYSLLPALSLDGILYAKVVEGSFTTALFRDFLEGLLDQMQPFPARNSVIIMDNARIHKDPRLIDLI
ncbi:hypothetical protein FIBSPDRAFT_664694, partial [Athelia psychrophila]